MAVKHSSTSNEYLQYLLLSFTLNNIQAGFRVTEIYPFDRNVLSPEDFLCSAVTNRPFVKPFEDFSNSLSEGLQSRNHSTVKGNVHQALPTTSTGESIDTAALPLATSHLTIPISSFYRPSDVRPNPKSALIKNIRHINKHSGYTRILTDTPTKLFVENKN